MARAAFRLAKLGEADQAILWATQQGLEKAGRRGKPGKTAVAVVAVIEGFPQPKQKKGNARQAEKEIAAGERRQKQRDEENRAELEKAEAKIQHKMQEKAAKAKKQKREDARKEKKRKEDAHAQSEFECGRELQSRMKREEQERVRHGNVREEREIEMRGRMSEMEERVLQLERMIKEREVSAVTEGTVNVTEKAGNVADIRGKLVLAWRDNRARSIAIQQEEESRRAAVELDRFQEFRRFQESRRADEAAAALASARRPERRLAEDGRWYTLEEFQMFYGGRTCGMHWNQAHVPVQH